MSTSSTGSSALLILVLLVAAGVLAFGIWRGRPDLGKRAFIGVVLTSLVVTIATFLLTVSFNRPNLPQMAINIFLATHLMGAVPVWIAGNWFQVIKEATEGQ